MLLQLHEHEQQGGRGPARPGPAGELTLAVWSGARLWPCRGAEARARSLPVILVWVRSVKVEHFSLDTVPPAYLLRIASLDRDQVFDAGHGSRLHTFSSHPRGQSCRRDLVNIGKNII